MFSAAIFMLLKLFLNFDYLILFYFVLIVSHPGSCTVCEIAGHINYKTFLLKTNK